MSFPRLIKLIAILGAASAAALLLVSLFVPGFSVLGSAGWVIYLIGGALVFFAFLRRSLAAKSKGIQESNGEHSQASGADQNIEDVRTRIRAIKRQTSRSRESNQD